MMSGNHDGHGWELIASPWHLDEYIPGFPIPAGTAEVIRPQLPTGPQVGRMIGVYQAVADAVARAERPLVLSGDCSAALGAVAGLQRRHDDIAVVWLDAHGDFNTPAITISGYLAGMSLAMLTGRAAELIGDPLRVRPVPDSDVVLVDARDLDPAERDALAASQVRRVPAEPDDIGRVLGAFGGKPVYLHVDVDIVDGAELPGMRFPTGQGPSLSLIQDCMERIIATADVVAACVACSWLPEHVSDPATSEAITRLGSALGAELAWQTQAR
jgi:arginase